jgi:hypothetical protein
MDGMYCWHGHIIANSIRSVINELESDLIAKWLLNYVGKLAERDETVLDACR